MRFPNITTLTITVASILIPISCFAASYPADIYASAFKFSCAEKQCPQNVGALFYVDEKKQWHQSTATLIDQNIIISNAHCIRDDDRQHDGADLLGKAYFRFSDGKQLRVKSVIKTSGYKNDAFSQDYAIFQLDENAERPPMKVSFAGFSDGEKMTVWKVTQTDTSSFALLKVQCATVQNTVFPPRFTDAQNALATLKNCNITHGNSGSPVINSKGEDVGLLSNALQRDDLIEVGFLIRDGENPLFARAENLACILATEKSPACFEHLSRDDYHSWLNQKIASASTLSNKNAVDNLQKKEGLWFSQNSKVFRWKLIQDKVSNQIPADAFVQAKWHPDGECIVDSASWLREYRILPYLYPKTSMVSGSLYEWVLGLGPTSDFKGFEPVAVSRHLGHFESTFDLGSLLRLGTASFDTKLFDSAGTFSASVTNQMPFCSNGNTY